MRRRNFLKTSLGAAGAALTLRSLPPALTFAGAGPLVQGAAAPLDAGYSSLRQAFENPPNDNRNWTRWWWFGPQATEQGIAYELEQMHKQGLGGAEEIVSSGENKVRCLASGNGVSYIRTGGSGKKRGRQEAVTKDLPAPLDISGEWQVTFEGYKFPKLVKKMPLLRSWTDDPDTRHFSGTARYELEFDVPAGILAKGRRVRLDLGSVADASKVWLNGQAAGVTWKRPHQHDVTQWVRPGNNFLEVRVSNRLINLVVWLKRRTHPPEPQAHPGAASHISGVRGALQGLERLYNAHGATVVC